MPKETNTCWRLLLTPSLVVGRFFPITTETYALSITIASAYVLATELQKRWFYRREQQRLQVTIA
jgi:hypothetical protein